jgi:hypothetical protein
MNNAKRISPLRELLLLISEGWSVLLGETRNLIISLLFPLGAAAVTVWIAGENMFLNCESTKSACFILVCSAIWCGLFNSIQSLVKERENVKRDYVSGALRIECYMGSRAIIQLGLCFLQNIILTLSIPIIGLIYGNPVPVWGLLGGPAIFEYFFSMLMIMYASDAMGLMISSMVKKDETASKLAPYVLIIQLLFSGVLFQLKGVGELLSGLTISNWGMKALGSISDLNHIPTKLFTELDKDELTHFPECPAIQMGASKCECSNAVIESLEFPAVDEMYDPTAIHLLLVLFVMFLFAIVPLVVGNIMMHRVKHDGRD